MAVHQLLLLEHQKEKLTQSSLMDLTPGSGGDGRIPSVPPAAGRCVRGPRGTAGYGNSDTVSHLHSGCRPARMSPPGAASGSCSARTNSGRGHGKRGDGSTESCCHWHSDWPACVRACVCVCVRVSLPVWTHRLTVNPWAACMICPILYCVSSSAQGRSGVTDRK